MQSVRLIKNFYISFYLLSGLEIRNISRGAFGPPLFKTWGPKPKSGGPNMYISCRRFEIFKGPLGPRPQKPGGHLENQGANDPWAPVSFEPCNINCLNFRAHEQAYELLEKTFLPLFHQSDYVSWTISDSEATKINGLSLVRLKVYINNGWVKIWYLRRVVSKLIRTLWQFIISSL